MWQLFIGVRIARNFLVMCIHMCIGYNFAINIYIYIYIFFFCVIFMFKDLCSSHQSICVDLSWQFYTYLCVYINKIQQAATVCRCLFTAKLLYMFRVSLAPIIRITSNCNCAYGTGHSVRATTFRQRGLGHASESLLLWHYDLYQKLQLQFDVLLMMSAIDTRNM